MDVRAARVCVHTANEPLLIVVNQWSRSECVSLPGQPCNFGHARVVDRCTHDYRCFPWVARAEPATPTQQRPPPSMASHDDLCALWKGGQWAVPSLRRNPPLSDQTAESYLPPPPARTQTLPPAAAGAAWPLPLAALARDARLASSPGRRTGHAGASSSELMDADRSGRRRAPCVRPPGPRPC